MRVREHAGVVVDVDHPRIMPMALSDLVDVVLGWQAGTDVEELDDAEIVNDVLNGSSQKAPVLRGEVPDLRSRAEDLLGYHPVDFEVV